MPISPSEREVLFGTPHIYRQMQKYIAAKRTCTIKELRNVFREISNGYFQSSIVHLTTRDKLVVREGDSLRFLGELEEIRGHQSDRVWKAAQILQTFTNPQLAKTAEVTTQYALHLTKCWEKKGVLKMVGRETKGKRLKIYRFCSQGLNRPTVIRDKEADGE